jgi:hypothetical protein
MKLNHHFGEHIRANRGFEDLKALRILGTACCNPSFCYRVVSILWNWNHVVTYNFQFCYITTECNCNSESCRSDGLIFQDLLESTTGWGGPLARRLRISAPVHMCLVRRAANMPIPIQLVHCRFTFSCSVSIHRHGSGIRKFIHCCFRSRFIATYWFSKKNLSNNMRLITFRTG